MNKCQNPSCSRETENPKFCSRKCSSIVNNSIHPRRILKTKCSLCNEVVKSYRHTKCVRHWEEYIASKLRSRTMGDIRLSSKLKGEHYSKRYTMVRVSMSKEVLELKKLPCAHCGYTKHVQLCHIKSVGSFPDTATVGEVNSRSNIIQLCPNCHWEFDNLPREEMDALEGFEPS